VTATLKDLVPVMLLEMIKSAAEPILLALVDQVIALLNPAGVLYKLVKTIYKAVKYFLKYLDKIKVLFGYIKDVFALSASGGLKDAIADKLEAALKSAAPLALAALATLIGIDSIPDKIRKALKTLKDKAQAPVVALLKALAAPFKKILDAILAKLGLTETVLGKPEPLEGVKDGAVWAGVSGSTVEPGLKYNPQLTVQAQLDLWEKQATDPKDKQLILTAKEKLVSVRSSGSRLLASLKAKQDKKGAKNVGGEKKTLSGDMKALAKALAPLIKKFGVAASSGDPCAMAGLQPGKAMWMYKTPSAKVMDRRPAKTTGAVSCEPRGPAVSVTVVDYAVALFDATHQKITSNNPSSHANDAARFWSQCVAGITGDDAGHVIAFSLGGPGVEPLSLTSPQTDFNIFPQEKYANRRDQRSREGRVARACTGTNRVCAKVKLEYGSTTTPARPTKTIYDVWVNGVQNPSAPINFATEYGPDIDNPV